MDRFLEILGDELEKILSTSTIGQKGPTWTKKGMMEAFYKAYAIAVAKYAAEKGIVLV